MNEEEQGLDLEELKKIAKLISEGKLDDPRTKHATMNLMLNSPEKWEMIKKILTQNYDIEFIPKGEKTTNELSEMALVIPANVNSFRFSSTKLTNSLILSPISEVLATNYGVNVSSSFDKKNGKNVITYFQILENSSIRLPENFEFTETTARYIDAVGSA